MTVRFTPCGSCHCLVKASDLACPFCDAPIVHVHLPPAPRLGRMSRSMWFAVGSSVAATATVACLGGHGSQDGSASSLDGAAGASSSSASPPASLSAGPTGSLCARSPCGPTTCDITTEYCSVITTYCFGGTSDTYLCKPRAAMPACVGS